MSNQSPQPSEKNFLDTRARLFLCGCLALGWILVGQTFAYDMARDFLWLLFALIMPWVLGLKPEDWPARMSFPFMTLGMTFVIFQMDVTFRLFHKEIYLPFFVLTLMGMTLLMIGPTLPESLQLLAILLQCSSFGYIVLGKTVPATWAYYDTTLGIILAACCFTSAMAEGWLRNHRTG